MPHVMPTETHHGPAGPDRGAVPNALLAARVGWGYVAALVAGAAAALVAFYLTLAALHVTDNLPPPAFSNTICVDEKLRFLRQHPAQSPDLLVVGSSIAWRTFDAAAAVRAQVAARPLNAGFCGLHTNQMAYVTDWLLDRHPTAGHVLLLTAPQDFAECRRKRTVVFDRDDVNGYLDRTKPQGISYLEYFSPLSLARNARKIKQRRTDIADLDPLIFDRFGGGPLGITRSRPTLLYGAPEPLEDECFEALRTLGQRLQREGRQFTVVLTPIHPAWKAKEDPEGVFMRDFRIRLHAVLKDIDAAWWDGDQEWTPRGDSFWDAIHLRWPAVDDFSRALAAQLRKPEVLLVQEARPGGVLK